MRGDARIVADGRERLEAAVAALPAEERPGMARRLELDRGPLRKVVGRVWPGRGVPPTVARWLRLHWGGSIDRRLYLRPSRPDEPRRAGARTGDR